MSTDEARQTARLYHRYYFSRPDYVDGTARFHQICRSAVGRSSEILEIGAGPKNATTAFLASIGDVYGLDISAEVLQNDDLRHRQVFDGRKVPFSADSFDLCISNYVLEHVADPAQHFREIARVLKPGASYCFRTPNLWHYVTLASKVLPHFAHIGLANRLRGLSADAHEPYPTVYRANTRGRLVQLALDSGLQVQSLEMVECEPCYGAAHPALFYPMMGYERLVNRMSALSSFRVNIFGCLRKPILHETPGGSD